MLITRTHNCCAKCGHVFGCDRTSMQATILYHMIPGDLLSAMDLKNEGIVLI